MANKTKKNISEKFPDEIYVVLADDEVSLIATKTLEDAFANGANEAAAYADVPPVVTIVRYNKVEEHTAKQTIILT